MTFRNEVYIRDEKLSKEQYLLRNVVQSFASKLYTVRSYLEENENSSKLETKQ